MPGSATSSVVILRNLARNGRENPRSFEPGSIPNAEWAAPGNFSENEEFEPQISVEELSKPVLNHARRDPTVVAIAPTMPLKLIEPLRGGGEVDEAISSGVAWGVKAVRADRSIYTGKNVVVAVLDTGIDSGHPAFKAADLQVITKDFTGTQDGDTHGHGTHCAGTIFGRDTDGVRIGVASGVRRALIGKVIGGKAGTDALIHAMEWAIGNGAQVISMSLGFDFVAYRDELESMGWPAPAATSNALQAFRDNIRLFDEWMALNSAREASNASSIVIAASGNESSRDSDRPYEINACSPAAAANVISVGALAQGSGGLVIAPFSNTNVKIAAPGVDIVSARLGGGLAAMSGTSMACPHVAGLAALYWDQLTDSSIRPTASAATNRLMAAAKFEGVFDSQIDMDDIGAGLASAP